MRRIKRSFELYRNQFKLLSLIAFWLIALGLITAKDSQAVSYYTTPCTELEAKSQESQKQLSECIASALRANSAKPSAANCAIETSKNLTALKQLEKCRYDHDVTRKTL